MICYIETDNEQVDSERFIRWCFRERTPSNLSPKVRSNVEYESNYPPDNLEVGEVGLPHLVRPGGLGVELVGGLDHDIGRTDDQVMGLQQAVNRGFRHKVLAFIGKSHRQFAR